MGWDVGDEACLIHFIVAGRRAIPIKWIVIIMSVLILIYFLLLSGYESPSEFRRRVKSHLVTKILNKVEKKVAQQVLSKSTWTNHSILSPDRTELMLRTCRYQALPSICEQAEHPFRRSMTCQAEIDCAFW